MDGCEVWQRAQVVCFDFDGTVVKQETLEELADISGSRSEIELW
jgi:phosphoserine phosphatase